MENILERKIFKVSQINAAARMALEVNFPSVYIEGEISNLAEPASGHIYFSLKDEAAQVRAVMFRHKKLALTFNPKNGSHVIVRAQISLYEARGDYQLIVEYIELAGAGVLYTKFLKLKAKLEAEKLFEISFKKPLPKTPHCVGVITSPTGSVIRDILTILNRRFPSVSVIIYPTLVQGIEAAEKIIAAIKIANERKECGVLILARGGGTLEDLYSFNDEGVARAIFASRIPIVSAVGHETDFTIADFVADVRAPTPSAAAELVVPSIANRLLFLTALNSRLCNAIQQKINNHRLLLANLCKLLYQPTHYLNKQAQHLDDLERRLSLGIKHLITYWQHKLTKAVAELDLISPLAILARGYAIVSSNGKIVKSIKNIKVDDVLQIKLSDGEIACYVKEIQQ